MEVFWLDDAVTDLREIIEYVTEQNPTAAPQVATSLYEAAQRLGRFPNLGRAGRIGDTRELIVPRLPFVLAYRITPERVEVVRVIHGRRDWQTAFGEREL